MENVSIKISGAGTLAQTPFPYPDIWEPLDRIITAFGIERCLWGTDWTRAIEFLSYRQGVDSFRLNDRFSPGDLDLLMGANVERIYRWTPST
jgi:L-fuconolactonase